MSVQRATMTLRTPSERTPLMSNLAASARITNSAGDYIVDVDVEGFTVDEAITKCRRVIDTLIPGNLYGIEVDQKGDGE
jgi:hypothetical protein